MAHRKPMHAAGVAGASAMLAGFTALSSVSHANLNLATEPLFLSSPVQPNIMFTLDDSGSMHWEITPDGLTQPYYAFPRVSGIYGGGDYTNSVPTFDEDNAFVARYRSVHGNSTYYDPTVDYQPWIRADGTRMADADEQNAYHNPMEPGRGSRELTVESEQTAWWTDGSGWENESRSFYPATYFWPEDGAEPGDYDDYRRIEIRPGEDFPSGRSYDDEIQNFANWYQYHRSRILSARGGIAEAFVERDERVRIGYGTINFPGDELATFDQNAKADFFERLYEDDIPAQGTPLRAAAQAVGDFFENSDTPWEGPDGELLECRRSYHVLMTDGYWNQDLPRSVGNVTGSSGEVIEGPDGRSYQYEPRSPFEESYSDTLADVAMDYWVRDLRPEMDNRVPPSPRFDNPAFWQHLVTLGVGLGVQGTIDPDRAFDAISDETIQIDWPDPSSDDEHKIDDLLRASVATRGRFFSAMDPISFSRQLDQMLSAVIDEATRSGARTATNTSFAQEGAKIYQARLESSDWSGDVLAFSLDPDTGVVKTPGEPEWSASEVLDQQWTDPAAQRNVLTWDSEAGSGTTFTWNGLSADMRAALHNDQDLLDYLRGSDAEEQRNDGDFRDRSSLLGDIVNSGIAFVGTPNFGYSRLPGDEGSDYRDWRRSSAYQDRTEMLYVGSNNGMLHALDADSGAEQFAFVPHQVLDRLPALAEPEYNHQFYVDGTPTFSDAYIDGEWRTVLVAGLGFGGRSVFALDVTDPENFSEDDVLWEFTHEELGYTIGEPRITRLGNGQWVAVFGNGYNSDSENASVFFVDLETGDELGHVEVTDRTGATNGMGPVLAADTNRDATGDRFYAGDLQGTLWRFDSEDGGVPNSATVLFRTPQSSGEYQPITTRPAISDNPDGNGVMVFFGTGKFLEATDNQITNNEQIQALYGVKDHGDTELRDSDLLEQTIESQGSATFGGQTIPIREVSSNSYDDTSAQRGWRLNLDHGDDTNGERVITPARVIGDRVRFATFTPSEDPCLGGGTNWLIELNAFSGGQLQEPTIDLSGDGEMDFSEGGFMIGEGPPTDLSQPGVSNEDGNEHTDTDPSRDGNEFDSESGVDPASRGRQSWREMR